MPIDKGREQDDQQPDDWQRVESEWSERTRAQRKWDETHDPSKEWEQAARPLPEDYGSHRPKSSDLTQEQVAKLVDVFGRPADELLALRDQDPRAGHNRDEHGNIRRPQAEQPPEQSGHGDSQQTETGDAEVADQEVRAALGEIAEQFRSGQLTPDQAADLLETYRQGQRSSGHLEDPHAPSSTSPLGEAADRQTGDQAGETQEHVGADHSGAEVSAWDHVEGDKPDRETVHVSEARRIHILDGNGLGDGGHLAGTGVPRKTEFPASWDDDRIIDAIVDVARNPDRPPELQRRGTWLAYGARDDVEVNAIVRKDGAISTGFPEHGREVIHNDEFGDPTTCTHRDDQG